MTDQQLDTQPWWKEPWPWIIMSGPFLALLGRAVTIALAVKHFSGQAIVDGGVRQGLVVKRIDADKSTGNVATPAPSTSPRGDTP